MNMTKGSIQKRGKELGKKLIKSSVKKLSKMLRESISKKGVTNEEAASELGVCVWVV